MKLKEKEIQNLEKEIPRIAKDVGRRAYKETIASGNSVLIAEKGWIIKISPDGSKDVIQKLDNTTSAAGVVEFQFTEDRTLLNQYYKLRQETYKDIGWDESDGSENEFDRKGKIVVAMFNKKVIGGARLMFSDQSDYLANEVTNSEYEYKTFIKRYDERSDLIIAEFSAFVVDKAHRDNNVSLGILDKIFEEAKNRKAHYVFAISYAIFARHVRGVIKQLNYNCEIGIDYPWKEKKIVSGHLTRFPVYAKMR